MNRVVIIGSPAAGKSTLARCLGPILHIKVIHLDRIFWKRGWREIPRDTRIDILEKLVQKKQWIIEGTYLSSSEPRLSAADAIIFLDTATLLCFKRIISRYLNHGRIGRDIPEGCEDKINLIRILKVLIFPFRDRRILLKKLYNFKFDETKHIIWLCSPKEVEDFLVQLRQDVNDQRDLFHEQTHLQVSEFATT
jgi:adenylate kinase family enzyme